MRGPAGRLRRRRIRKKALEAAAWTALLGFQLGAAEAAFLH
jgi:hypothetical protein